MFFFKDDVSVPKRDKTQEKIDRCDKMIQLTVLKSAETIVYPSYMDTSDALMVHKLNLKGGRSRSIHLTHVSSQ